MKTTDKPISKAQLSKIHVLLNQRGLLDEKASIVYSVSNGRTESTKELTCHEGRQMIGLLVTEQDSIEADKRKAIFKAIYRLAWKMDIIYGDTEEDYRMNIAKLNVFCRQRGTVKKNLTEQNLPEMRRTHRQFEAMFKNYKPKK